MKTVGRHYHKYYAIAPASAQYKQALQQSDLDWLIGESKKANNWKIAVYRCTCPKIRVVITK